MKVAFKVKDTWVGNASTVAIKIKTLLGEKYLAVDPLGAKDQDPARTIPESRTVSPYDVTDAFNGLANTVGQLDTDQLAQSFQDIANAFGNTAPDVHSTLQGLAALSETISSRDNQLSQLLANTKQITGDLANEDTSSPNCSTTAASCSASCRRAGRRSRRCSPAPCSWPTAQRPGHRQPERRSDRP